LTASAVAASRAKVGSTVNSNAVPISIAAQSVTTVVFFMSTHLFVYAANHSKRRRLAVRNPYKLKNGTTSGTMQISLDVFLKNFTTITFED
jgi:hypothetical protein